MKKLMTSKMKTTLLALLMVAGAHSTQAQWNNTGPQGISNGWTNYNDIIIDKTGAPVIVYYDVSTLSGYCLRYDGMNWEQPGLSSFNFPISGDLKLMIDQNNHYYIYFKDKNNGYPSCIKYNGTSWNYFGTQYITQQAADYSSITFDNNGVMHAVIVGTQGFEMFKQQNGSWLPVTTNMVTNSIAYMSLAFDHTNTAYLAFCNINTLKANCLKLNGTNWTPAGNANFSTGFAQNIKLIVDDKNQKFIAYHDGSTTCKMLDTLNHTWTAVGAPGLDANRMGIEDLAADADGNIYISTSNSGNDKARCLKYDGSTWSQVGNNAISDTLAGYPAIAFNENGILYAMYNDYIQEKVFVKNMGTATTVNEEIKTSIGSLYPNPAQNELNITINTNNTRPVNYEIINASGKMVKQGDANQMKNTIQTNDLSPGLYFVRLNTGNSNQTLKFIRSN